MMADSLDRIFTRPEVAVRCWETMRTHLRRLGLQSAHFIEPSVGDGAFYDLLPPGSRTGVDLDPRRPGFVRHDFLTWEPPSTRQPLVVVGNPPFGHRGDMAVRFFRKAGTMADAIGFVVPAIFRKFSIHRQLPDGWRLVSSTPLPRSAFWTERGSGVRVNTQFQIWTRLPGIERDLRLRRPPPRAHPDFRCWQYNNTTAALKVFDEPFEFAVPCQGWQDYTRRETKADHCEKHKQWMLFEPVSRASRGRLYAEIDYERLAMTCATAVPGFRKNDLVQEYLTRYQPVDKTPRRGIRPRRDGEPPRPGGCGALSPSDGGPNRLRDPFRPLSRGGRTLPGGASRRVGARGTFSTACHA